MKYHAIHVHKTYQRSEIDSTAVTGYGLSKNGVPGKWLLRTDVPASKDEVIAKLSELLREGWEITTIFYSTDH